MKLTLLKVQEVEIRDVDHIKDLIQYHKDQLCCVLDNLNEQGATAKIQVIAYNIIHLSRELERRNDQRERLKVFSGGKH